MFGMEDYLTQHQRATLQIMHKDITNTIHKNTTFLNENPWLYISQDSNNALEEIVQKSNQTRLKVINDQGVLQLQLIAIDSLLDPKIDPNMTVEMKKEILTKLGIPETHNPSTPKRKGHSHNKKKSSNSLKRTRK